MTTALWCLAFLAFLPYVLAGTGTYLRVKELGHLDNHTPRQQWQQVKGAGARIYAAQQNAWEALMFFTAAVVVTHFAGADPNAVGHGALVFTASRVAHAVFYAVNLAAARSLVFLVGFAAWCYLIWLAGTA